MDLRWLGKLLRAPVAASTKVLAASRVRIIRQTFPPVRDVPSLSPNLLEFLWSPSTLVLLGELSKPMACLTKGTMGHLQEWWFVGQCNGNRVIQAGHRQDPVSSFALREATRSKLWMHQLPVELVMIRIQPTLASVIMFVQVASPARL
jgi:hypothetical protein